MSTQRKSPKIHAVVIFAVVLILATTCVLGEEEKGDDGEQRVVRLNRMQERARDISLSSSENSEPFQLIPNPLFRYDDQPRRIVDATLWGWGGKGRPLALCKIEDYQREQSPLWVYCLASLCPHPIEAKWKNGRTWTATKPGLVLHDIAGEPKPATNSSARLLQIKQLSRRFASVLIDPRDESRQEMRLLPQPVARYSENESGLLDGAIFAFASNGTNPDAVVLIELHQSSTQQSTWQYGLAAMTANALSVRLDDREVWTKEFTPDPDHFDNWMFFSVPQLK